MGMITNRDENKWHINASVWDDLMEDALKYPNKTYAELKMPYSFELDKITDDFVEKIKEIIYDLRNDITFNHFIAGLHLGMIAITGSSIEFEVDTFRIEAVDNIGLGTPCPSVELQIANTENMTYTITYNTGNELDWNIS